MGSNFNDDPAWLVLAVSAYLKETGDWSILDEPVPYDNQPGSETPLYEHLQRCLRYTLERIGPHGLPLIGRADWNDCLNLNCFSSEPGQSFQTTTNKDGKVAEVGLYRRAVRAGGRRAGGHRRAARAETVDAAALPARGAQDGRGGLAGRLGWRLVPPRLRRFRPAGWLERVRRRADLHRTAGHLRDGRAGRGGRARAAQALDAVGERLATPHGIVLQQPAYSQYYLELGEISSYPPGYKENAGIFCHTNPWIMIAETILGRGDRAYDYYLRINPSTREEISELHRCEPYVYAQMIAGRDAPTHGEAKNSWLSGTAAWNYVAISQWILGIRPELDGLRVDPCIPAAWDGFQRRAPVPRRGVSHHGDQSGARQQRRAPRERGRQSRGGQSPARL